jgi:murein DD-endopeptidase MepM/ murein hydrolase activator NlpD
VTGSIKAPPGARMIPIPEPNRPKPSPISDTVIFTAPPERHARLESRGVAAPAAPIRTARASVGGIDGILTRLQGALDRVELRQTGTLGALEESFDSKARRIKGMLADLGLDVGKSTSDAVGGPFVPYRLPANANAFDRQLHRINLARAQVNRLTRVLVSVPIRKPVMGEIDTTSTFGVRVDPFIGRPAMHTGLDFRGNMGDPIRATASGTVTSAGWSGGYGRMVEVDHGNGVATRYGHLSEIDVHVGQPIRIGQTVGKLGSTGRSTGPHLHYETRVAGDAVDPQKFLRAGIRMGTL